MSVRLDNYKIFLEVCDKGSFSKAAEALFMTQPAVSQGISQLEQYFSIRLFTRMPKGVKLTEEGKLLKEHVAAGMQLLQKGEKKLFDVKNLSTGTLKIGVGDTISKYFLMPYLERFHREAPNIQLKVINRTSIEVVEMLKSGELDIALCNLPIQESMVESLPCLEIQDIFVCGKGFLEYTKKPLSLLEISKLPLILLEPRANSRRYIEEFFREKGISIQPEIELGSHDLLLDFAKINLGVACVTEEFSKEFLQNKEVFPISLKEPIPKRSIGFCFLKEVSLSPASEKLMNLVLEKRGKHR